MAQYLKIAFEQVKDIAGKEENADYQHFLLSLQCIQNLFIKRSLKVGIV